MGNSESRTLTNIYEHDPAKPASKARQENALDAVRVRTLEVEALAAAPEIWHGTAYDLARKIRDEVIQSGRDINTRHVFTRALQDACNRYVRPNGKPYTAKSLRASLHQWELKNR
jgi:hypothetical protein